MRVLHYKNLNLKKVKIKILKRSDVSKRYVSWLNNYEVVKHTDLISNKHTFKSVQKYVIEMNKSKNNFLYGIFYGSYHIGNLKVGPVLSLHKTAYIGYIIGEKRFWNCGIGTLVIKKIKQICKKNHQLIKLNAGVSILNKPSQLILKKNKFKLEGNFRKQIIYKNKRFNLLKYGCVL